MIEHLKSLAIFASVVEAGSFRGAAARLDLSPSVVSEHISRLERELGVALMYRSTRSLSLTEKGEALYPQAQSMVRQAREGLSEFTSSANYRLTTLRIALPATMNAHPIVNRITDFATMHRGLQVQLYGSDRQADLQREGIDIAIRMGFFKDSDLTTRRIGVEQRMLVAAPSYLDQNPKIQTPADLADHAFVSFSLVPDVIELTQDTQKIEVWGRTVITADSAEMARALALTGIGLAALPYEALKLDLEYGRLRHVLPNWTEKELPIYLTWPKNAALNSTTRNLIDFLSAS